MNLLRRSPIPAYHLRPNKAVDRLLFIEMIHALELYIPIDKHTYVSLGGPFLEDIRLVAQSFPKLSLVSIEEDVEIYKRQKFHHCSTRLTLRREPFATYLATSYPTSPTITWADFVDFDRETLTQVSDIARKATPSSMLRVTVRAVSPVFDELRVPRREFLPAGRAKEFDAFSEDFQKRFTVPDAAYDRSWFSWPAFGEEQYPTLVCQMLNAAIAGACAAPKRFMPLHACMYSDGTVMLSFTGIFCLAEHWDETAAYFAGEGYLAGKAIHVEPINVPALTTKERLHLEGLLPTKKRDGRVCQDTLKYLIEGERSERESVYRLEQYERYHRFYPYFAKMSV